MPRPDKKALHHWKPMGCRLRPVALQPFSILKGLIKKDEDHLLTQSDNDEGRGMVLN